MAGIGQYLKDTRGELRHVAWPTRGQTVVYTVLIALLSIGISLYLGLFDYIFTGTLTRVVGALPQTPTVQTQTTENPTTPTQTQTQTTQNPQSGNPLQLVPTENPTKKTP